MREPGSGAAQTLQPSAQRLWAEAGDGMRHCTLQRNLGAKGLCAAGKSNAAGETGRATAGTPAPTEKTAVILTHARGIRCHFPGDMLSPLMRWQYRARTPTPTASVSGGAPRRRGRDAKSRGEAAGDGAPGVGKDQAGPHSLG